MSQVSIQINYTWFWGKTPTFCFRQLVSKTCIRAGRFRNPVIMKFLVMSSQIFRTHSTSPMVRGPRPGLNDNGAIHFHIIFSQSQILHDQATCHAATQGCATFSTPIVDGTVKQRCSFQVRWQCSGWFVNSSGQWQANVKFENEGK